MTSSSSGSFHQSRKRDEHLSTCHSGNDDRLSCESQANKDQTTKVGSQQTDHTSRPPAYFPRFTRVSAQMQNHHLFKQTWPPLLRLLPVLLLSLLLASVSCTQVSGPILLQLSVFSGFGNMRENSGFLLFCLLGTFQGRF